MITIVALSSSILLGSMLFFAAIVTPTAFRSLQEEEAGTYIREIFPKFYLWGIVLSALAVIFSLLARSATAIMLLIVLIGFIYSRQVLMPKITKAKEKWLASDTVQHKSRFQELHKRSVIINITQMLLLLITSAATTWTVT